MRYMPSKYKEIFARNIRYLRELRGWTQEDVSEKIGVTQKQIAKYESGRDWVSADALVEYAKTFGVTTDQLLGREPIIPDSGSKAG